VKCRETPRVRGHQRAFSNAATRIEDTVLQAISVGRKAMLSAHGVYCCLRRELNNYMDLLWINVTACCTACCANRASERKWSLDISDVMTERRDEDSHYNGATNL